MQALFAEQGNSSEEQQLKKRDLAHKAEKISSFASSIEKMKGLTGFTDGAGDLTKDLFTLVALLELYSSAYVEADCYFARAHSMSSVVNPPRDRLLCYLQLVSQLKRVATEKRKPRGMESASSARTSSTSRASSINVDVNALKNTDLSDAEELFKLKGSALDEPILRLILKSFLKKQDYFVQQERLQSESALANREEAHRTEMTFLQSEVDRLKLELL